MKTALELYRKWGQERMLADWPKGAPQELLHFSAEEAREAFKEANWGGQLPRAELTEELAAQFDKAQQAEAEGFRNLIGLGNSLLPLRKDYGESEFWKYCAIQIPQIPQADVEFAMKVAEMVANE